MAVNLERVGLRRTEVPRVFEKPGSVREVFGFLEILMAQRIPSLNEVREKFSRRGNELFEIYKEDLARFKQWAEKSGREWSGRVERIDFPREQDGLIWGRTEAVEIGDKIEIVSKSFEHSREAKQYVAVIGVMSGDENSLERVEWQEWKVFKPDGGGEEEKIPIYSAVVELKNNRIFSARIERNIDMASHPYGLYHKPRRGIVKHEIYLPPEGTEEK